MRAPGERDQEGATGPVAPAAGAPAGGVGLGVVARGYPGSAAAGPGGAPHPAAGGGQERGADGGQHPGAGGTAWQQALNAWNTARLAWQRPAGWAPAEEDRQQTLPIPVVRADVSGAAAEPPPAASGAMAGTPGAGSPAGAPAGPPVARPGRSSRWSLRSAVGMVTVLAVALLVAGGVVAVRIWRSHQATAVMLVAGYPSAHLAGSVFGGLPAGSAPPGLAGVAASGHTVVVIGSQPGAPGTRPLLLVSGDGGQTWQRASLAPLAPGTGPAPGSAPVMVAGGHGKWLALAPDASWTSPDGRSWREGPGLRPLAPGDHVLAIARTGRGFVAVGANVPARGGGPRTPVVWTSRDGLAWHRWPARELGLKAGRGRVVALRWVAARGGTVVAGGEVVRARQVRRGHRTVTTASYAAQLWQSPDGGAQWRRVSLPPAPGETSGLAGVAEAGQAFVAVRPGRGPQGLPEALAYVSDYGSRWHLAGRLAGEGGAGLRVSVVAGGDDGAVIAGSASNRPLALVSGNGRVWRVVRNPAVPPGTLAGVTLAGAVAVPGGRAVLAGARNAPAGERARRRGAGAGPAPLLLLAGARGGLVGRSLLGGMAGADVAVRDVAAGAGRRVAVGSAGGAPAIWSVPAGAGWPAAAPVIVPAPRGDGPGLTSVADGPAGWLAVGAETAPPALGRPAGAAPAGTGPAAAAAAAAGLSGPGAVARTVAVTSPDGRSWRSAGPGMAFRARGAVVTGAAAGRSGYVVVGAMVRHGLATAQAWWSGDLIHWRTPPSAAAGTAGAAGGGGSAMVAVTARPAGFAAVGQVGTHPAVWLSADGRSWLPAVLPLPAGAASATLTRIAVAGNRLVAAGVWHRAASAGPAGTDPVAFTASSADGGRTWREEAMPAVGGPATVTVLTSVPGGFVAAGAEGAARQQRVVLWWSRDGVHWQASPAPGRAPGGTAIQRITALSVSGGLLTGIGYRTGQAGDQPVIWTARAR